MSATTTVPDLWPAAVAETPERTPVLLLKQQAALLGSKTKNVVTADVKVHLDGNTASPVADFRLWAPMLRYRHILFQVKCPLVPEYPVVFFWNRESYEACSESEFLDHIKQILSSEETKKIIGNLIANSRE